MAVDVIAAMDAGVGLERKRWIRPSYVQQEFADLQSPPPQPPPKTAALSLPCTQARAASWQRRPPSPQAILDSAAVGPFWTEISSGPPHRSRPGMLSREPWGRPSAALERHPLLQPMNFADRRSTDRGKRSLGLAKTPHDCCVPSGRFARRE